jgi:hypothetical protein
MSYRNQALYIDKRTQSTSQSVIDSLNLGFQQLAQSQNMNTLSMARSAKEDSVAIRAITFVTSFYLPFSFVAVGHIYRRLFHGKLTCSQTMFGMNLVDFDSNSRNLLVSNQFWLYFVISVPLTVVTLACWRWRTKSYRDEYQMNETGVVEDSKPLQSASDIEMGHMV